MEIIPSQVCVTFSQQGQTANLGWAAPPQGHPTYYQQPSLANSPVTLNHPSTKLQMFVARVGVACWEHAATTRARSEWGDITDPI